MDAYLISVLTFIGIWVLLAVSLNLLVGYAGQVSIGHAAFFGIGAYTSAVATVRFGIGFPHDLLAATVLAGIFGGLLGLPALRVRHDFLVLATIGINFIVVAIFQYTPALGGAYGIVGVPPITIAGVEFYGLNMMVLVWAIVAVVLGLKTLLLKTWFAVRLIAIREDEAAAAAIGINVAATKIWAFVLSSAIAGLAGALYARQLGSVFPENFGFVESVTVLAMVVLGGAGTLIGPVVGAVILGGLPEYLRFLADWRYVFYGLILMAVMIFERDGLLGPQSRLRRALARRRRARGTVGR